MESGFLSGGVTELQQAKEAIIRTNSLQAAYNAAQAEASGKEKDLESQKKYITDKTASVMKERRAQLKKVHDEQVDLANKNLKDAEKKRRAAKSDAVQNRISNETAGYVGENEDLKKKIKMLFRENKVPSFCNTRFYYALYAPKKASDFVILVITVLITLGVIPNVVCLLLNTDKMIIKILVYLAIVVFFVGIYFIVFLISKRNTKGEILEIARPYRDGIAANRKSIKSKSRTIEKDTDESGYALEGYDTEIANFQNILNDKIQKREEALKEFDEKTAVEIRSEIERENQAVVEKMTAELEESRQALESAKAEADQAANELANTYEVYLGKRNMAPERIDGLIALIQDGKASTVMEALDIVNGEIK